MPKKRDPDATHGEKLIRLFADLLFTGKKRSQTELGKMLKCTPQTVRRLLDSITSVYQVRLKEEKRGKTNVFWIERPETIHAPPMSREEITVLEMGQAFSRNLLGEKGFKTATAGLQKSLGMLSPEEARSCADELAALSDGRIDYAPFTGMLADLVQACSRRRVCRVRYKRLESDSTREFFIMPLKVFSHKDTVYVHCRRCTKAGLPRPENTYDPLLALQRFDLVEPLNQTFEFPGDFDFEASFARTFGVVKENPFKVRVRFDGWAAAYVSERDWSQDQKIVRKRDGGIELEFSASSETEVIGWVLSFGENACLVKPDRMRKKIAETLRAALASYEL